MEKRLLFKKTLWHIMRLTFVQLILMAVFCSVAYAHDVEAQEILNKNVSLKAQSESLKTIIAQIEKQTNARFVYSDTRIPIEKQVNIEAVKQKLSTVLTDLFPPLSIQYRVSGNYIVLSRMKNDVIDNSLVTPNENLAPVFIITGQIKDEAGENLTGATVTLEGTTKGTVTDENGKYSLTLEDEDKNKNLVFSYVGFQKQIVSINGQFVIDIILKEDNALNEVVVVGYNSQKRADLTGAVSSVKGSDISNLPVTSLTTALQGRVPGAYISQIDGNPNGNSSIVIRGPLSINGGEPLYVVDGVPFQGTGFSFNAQDVESIDILKDASAAAIYGFRAAGGVILIKTKKGSSGKIKIGLNSSMGLREAINLPSLLGKTDYIRAKEQFGFNVVDLYGAQSAQDSLPNTNWIDEMYRTGMEQNHTLFLSGGSDKSNFYLSGNYSKINGTRLGNEVERYTFRINSDHKLTKWLKIGQTLYGSFKKEDPNSATNQGELSFRSTPVMAVYDPNNAVGGWGKTPKGFQGGNDVQAVLGNFTDNQTYNTLLTVNLDAEIAKGLLFRTVVGAELSGNDNYFYNYKADIGAGVVDETFGKTINKRLSLISTYTLQYNKTFGKHNVNVLGGYEARRANFSELQANNRNPFVPIPQDITLVPLTTSVSVSGRNSDVDDRSISQFGRLEYAFNNKYLLTGTVRRDGLASKFGPKNRYGIFPGFSAGWRISEEGFMSKIKQISSLKLRAGYGILGNAVSSDFAYSNAYSSGFFADLGGGSLNSVTLVNRLANENIRWESVATANFGLDLGLFNNKLFINLDYYDRQTKDMIYNVGIANSAGLAATAPANVGQMSNKGFEFNVEYRNSIKKDFTYSISVNGATNQNQLLSLVPSLGRLFLTNGNLTEAHNNAVTSRSEPGREVGHFFGYQVLGIYENNAATGENRPKFGTYVPVAGDLIYNDLNADGIINASDRDYIGSPWPKLVYGFNLKAGWRNIECSLLFNGISGGQIYNAFQTYEHSLYSDYNTTDKIFATSGFNGQGVTSLPRVGKLTDNDRNQNWTSVNSFHVQDASYLRLRNVQLSYTLPNSLANRLKISNFKIYAMAENVLTFTSYKGINPDLGTGGFLNRGIDNANRRYPVSRIVTFGINADF